MISEHIRTINIINHSISVPKLHGHMKLELEGCREKQVIEHDNNMTDFLERMFSNKGVWINAKELYNALSPSIEKAFGAILLTDKVIPDKSITLPGGIEVNACAAFKYANSGIELTQGSYNEKESIYDSASRKMTYVYDWNTSQGNGTISAAALTHCNAGYCGYGDDGYTLNTSPKTTKNLWYYSNSSTSFSYMPVFVNDKYIVIAKLSNNKLTLYRTYNNMTAINPIFGSWKDIYQKYDVIEFDTTELNAIDKLCIEDDSIYFTSNKYINDQQTFILYKISDISENITMSEITIKNNTGKRIDLGPGIDIYKGLLYVMTYDKEYLCEINIENQADTNIYYIKTSGSPGLNRIMNAHAGKIYINSGSILIFDTVTKSIKKTGLVQSDKYPIINQSENPISYNNYDMSACLRQGCLYLATINNFESSVSKTADKTMKVTYSIQN